MSNTIHAIDMVKNSTLKQELGRIAAASELIAVNTGKMEGEEIDWAMIRNYVRAGLILKILQVGDQVVVEKESGLSVTVLGSVTGAAVNEETFVEKTGHAGTMVYEFVYDGSVWHLDGAAVELPAYGITPSGTPAEGDIIAIHETASEIVFDVVAVDFDNPANPDLEHSLTLLTRDVLLYNSIAFDPPEALFAVTADDFPDGMPAGTYYITLDHGAYGGETGEDGSYSFATTKTIPVGGKIRHTKMGAYSGTGYSQQRVVEGTFVTYDANYETLESGLETTVGATGTSLGTATGSNPQYISGSHVNFTERNAYGSNDGGHSANRKWLNSDAAGAASGQIASWWYASNEFDMPVKSTLPGLMHGLDPSFVKCVKPVLKRTAFSIADGYGYADTEELFFLPSMTEMGFGKNNNVVETSPKADGTEGKNAAYDLYADATNADRIKTQGGVARRWWLRSPLPSYASDERYVHASGALNYDHACNAYGVVAACAIA